MFRRLIIAALVVNLLWGALQLPTLLALRGVTRVVIMDKFYALQDKGVIDMKALNEHFRDKLGPGDSYSVSAFFLGEAADLPLQIGVISSMLFFLDVIILMWAKREVSRASAH